MGRVAVPAHPAQLWFGQAPQSFLSFHWHGEAFTVPPGAERVLSNSYCENQAFALGKHLGMQCHIEMTQEMVDAWCESGAGEIDRSTSPAVQPVAVIKTDLDRRLSALHQIADRVYDRWVTGLV